MTRTAAKPFFRERHGHAKVTNEELFFDLVYPVAFVTDRLMVGGLTSAILIAIAVWQSRHAPAKPAGATH